MSLLISEIRIDHDGNNAARFCLVLFNRYISKTIILPVLAKEKSQRERTLSVHLLCEHFPVLKTDVEEKHK